MRHGRVASTGQNCRQGKYKTAQRAAVRSLVVACRKAVVFAKRVSTALPRWKTAPRDLHARCCHVLVHAGRRVGIRDVLGEVSSSRGSLGCRPVGGGKQGRPFFSGKFAATVPFVLHFQADQVGAAGALSGPEHPPNPRTMQVPL